MVLIYKVGHKVGRNEAPLAEKKMMTHFAGRVPIYVHPCFNRSVKLKQPLDVGGFSKDGWVTTELGTGSLLQAVGILTVSKVSGSDVSKPCHVRCEGTEGSKQVFALPWWTLEPQCNCRCRVRDPLNLCCGLSGAGERLCRFLSIRKTQ